MIIRERFGTWLVKIGMWMRGYHERFGEQDYAVVDGIHCAVCRNCGGNTQTTDSICWMCRLAYDKQKGATR